MKLTYEQALNRAAALCSQSERCSGDIFTKARSWGLTEPEAARLVGSLTRDGFLDEARYAQAFVSDKFRFEQWGRVKICYALRAKGIDDRLIDEALDAKINPDDYLATCADLLNKKMRTLELPLSPADRARLIRFASQRGFESYIISKALHALSDQS